MEGKRKKNGRKGRTKYISASPPRGGEASLTKTRNAAVHVEMPATVKRECEGTAAPPREDPHFLPSTQIHFFIAHVSFFLRDKGFFSLRFTLPHASTFLPLSALNVLFSFFIFVLTFNFSLPFLVSLPFFPFPSLASPPFPR